MYQLEYNPPLESNPNPSRYQYNSVKKSELVQTVLIGILHYFKINIDAYKKKFMILNY